MPAARAQVREVLLVAGDALDERIDLVVGPVLRRTPVRRERADAEPDDRDVRRGLRLRDRIEDLPDRTRPMVIAQRLAAPGGVETLHALHRRAVEDEAVAVRLVH